MYSLAVIFALLTPVAMLVIGIVWKVHPPKYGAGGLAYRTELSSRNEETWKFAHSRISALWVRLGILLGLVAGGLMAFIKDSYASVILWIIGVEMAFLCISAFLVDTALKHGFDENGNKIL